MAFEPEEYQATIAEAGDEALRLMIENGWDLGRATVRAVEECGVPSDMQDRVEIAVFTIVHDSEGGEDDE